MPGVTAILPRRNHDVHRNDPGPYSWLKNPTNLDPLTHFSICISRHLVQVHQPLELWSPAAQQWQGFFVFLLRFFIFLNTNPDSIVQPYPKMHLITEAYTLIILRPWISLLHDLSAHAFLFWAFFSLTQLFFLQVTHWYGRIFRQT